MEGWYYKGIWRPGEGEKTAAVVGSRKMTEYGRRVTEKLTAQLVERKYTIISGFMYGVDQTAHQAAIECGGKTVAVLGWGIDWKMSPEDIRLADKIIESGGAVVSQWKDQEPTRWTFPMRNKVVVELAQEVYVVEAAAKSGALITARLALAVGKPVWAVPGPVTSKVSVGTNLLIASGLAKIWTGINDTCDGVEVKSITENADIYTAIQSEGLTVDEIVRKVKRPVDEVSGALTVMILKGLVKENEGRYYSSD
jgi:DNA processing protein